MPSPDSSQHSFNVFEEIGEEPESEPAHDCDCWRLTRPMEADEELPDHICVETASVTTRRWWRQQASDLFGNVQMDRISEGADEDETSPQPLPLHHALNYLSAQWPLPYRGRRLGFVIQQWTEGSPSPTLAKQLKTDIRWQRELRTMRQLYNFLANARAGDPPQELSDFTNRIIGEEHGGPAPLASDTAFVDEWVRLAGWSGSESGLAGQDIHAIDNLQDRLRWLGLPYSLSVLRHLRAVAIGLDEPLPAAEFLVSSFVYVELEEDGKFWCRQNHELLVYRSLAAGSLEGTRKIAAIAKLHREFTELYTNHPFADLSSIRRAQRGSAADPAAPVRTAQSSDSTDYIEEARNNIDELRKLADGHENGPLGAVKDYLDRIQRRVSNRRSRRMLSTTPPDGWRDIVRHELLQALEANK